MRWKKPNGMIIETNDEPATLEGAKALGWVPEGEDGGPKKRGRPRRNTDEAADDRDNNE